MTADTPARDAREIIAQAAWPKTFANQEVKEAIALERADAVLAALTAAGLHICRAEYRRVYHDDGAGGQSIGPDGKLHSWARPATFHDVPVFVPLEGATDAER